VDLDPEEEKTAHDNVSGKEREKDFADLLGWLRDPQRAASRKLRLSPGDRVASLP